MADLAPLDLGFQGRDRVIGAYVLDTEDGPALFDCGPASSIPRLKDGLGERGLALSDIRHLLLSHIHLDHAGAAGSLVREHPGLQVHVSEIGAPHLLDPSRLEASARRLYGDAFDTLWGELAPVPEENLHVVGPNVVGAGADEEAFAKHVRDEIGESADDYEHAMPFWQSYAGLKRFVDKRATA